MTAALRTRVLAMGLLAALAAQARAADLVALSPQTWDRYIPHGKEVDGIYGDFAMTNDQVIAVIAHPKRGRNANMTVREVGGCLIDLTRRDRQSDQLSAFYPGAGTRDLKFAGIDVEAPEAYDTESLDRVFVRARRVTLKLVATPREKEPDVAVSYTLEDGSAFVVVTTEFSNRGKKPVRIELADGLRADRSFERSPDNFSDLFWVDDLHFGQAYGVAAEQHAVVGASGRQIMIRYRGSDGKVAPEIPPGSSYRLTRRIIPGANLFDVRRVAEGLSGQPPRTVRLTVKDTAGKNVAGADVELTRESKRHARGRTNANGVLELAPGEGAGTLTVSAPGRGSEEVAINSSTPQSLPVELEQTGAVAAKITDEQGGLIACKVQFIGRNGTASPDFGPDSGETAIKNVYYSHDGRFRQELPPGWYDVIVSHGPEYDAVFTRLEVARGVDAKLDAKLVRSVRSDGWISTDFHSHSSPSGDNTSSQLGRVQNLLCEHIEFAPCTEHNRLSTYDPHLKRLGAVERMATCVGIELTGQPLPLNHQNAFPLVLRPRTQDGGGPTSDSDPAIQIERLALWDASSEKLVQVNHPDIGWMFRDRNGDGTPDSGFAGMFGHMDAIEVHPIDTIFAGPTVGTAPRTRNNTVVNWLQLLNQGRRITGVVNTDAHYNFHGSGFLRNYVKSPTDDPALVKTLDVVHAAERGQLIMTSGPFLEVKLRTASGGTAEAGPGETLAAPEGRTTLRVRVQCPNWFDVDRVQVFLNGKPVESLNYTRKANPDRFLSSNVKFEQEIPVQLQGDTHIVVATIGEGSKLGPVMGPDHARDSPVAVSNPIFVDVDGGGFKPTGDPLGKLPVKAGN